MLLLIVRGFIFRQNSQHRHQFRLPLQFSRHWMQKDEIRILVFQQTLRFKLRRVHRRMLWHRTFVSKVSCRWFDNSNGSIMFDFSIPHSYKDLHKMHVKFQVASALTPVTWLLRNVCFNEWGKSVMSKCHDIGNRQAPLTESCNAAWPQPAEALSLAGCTGCTV